jgi:hypothetical protein
MSRNQTPSGDPTLPPIHTVRSRRIVLDSDLAALYGVPTFRLNEAIKRNADRFPADFRFQLTAKELANLISQIAISSSDLPQQESVPPNSSPIAMSPSRHGGLRKLPWAFTEHGALMAATVLNSPRAVEMSLFIVRAFVRLRDELMTNAVVLKRLAQIDKTLLEHDLVLRDVVEKLLPLLNAPPTPEPPKRRIGFNPEET